MRNDSARVAVCGTYTYTLFFALVSVYLCSVQVKACGTLPDELGFSCGPCLDVFALAPRSAPPSGERRLRFARLMRSSALSYPPARRAPFAH